MFSLVLLEVLVWCEGDYIIYFVVIDVQGNVVVVIFLVNLLFGVVFIVFDIGVVLNNEMDDFVVDIQGVNSYGLVGSQVNVVVVGKCLLLSMSLSFLESLIDFVVFGIFGGSCILSMVLIFMLQYFDGCLVG